MPRSCYIARALGALLAATVLGGCISIADHAVPTAAPPAPGFQPRVEHTVGEFTFVLGGGDPAPHAFDGRVLGTELMRAWKSRGYIRDQHFVEPGAFSPESDYRLTLSGSHRGAASFAMQAINTLTLGLVPYHVHHTYDVSYALEDLRAGKTYQATVQASDDTWVELLLIVALPLAPHGHRVTVRRMADQLYEQFEGQGAFRPVAPSRS